METTYITLRTPTFVPVPEFDREFAKIKSTILNNSNLTLSKMKFPTPIPVKEIAQKIGAKYNNFRVFVQLLYKQKMYKKRA